MSELGILVADNRLVKGQLFQPMARPAAAMAHPIVVVTIVWLPTPTYGELTVAETPVTTSAYALPVRAIGRSSMAQARLPLDPPACLQPAAACAVSLF